MRHLAILQIDRGRRPEELLEGARELMRGNGQVRGKLTCAGRRLLMETDSEITVRRRAKRRCVRETQTGHLRRPLSIKTTTVSQYYRGDMIPEGSPLLGNRQSPASGSSCPSSSSGEQASTTKR